MTASTSPLAIKWWHGIPHEPHLMQHFALLREWLPEILFGGAAGGGKSDWLLMSALQYVDVPGYAALILRRTFPELKQSEGMLPRAQEWLTGKAHGVDTVGGLPTKWIFPSGAVLEFGHMQHEKDRLSYKGGAWQMVGFDETSAFLPTQYLYMFSRCRRPLDSYSALARVPLRIRGASNPGDVGHEFLKDRFQVTAGQATSTVEDEVTGTRLFVRSTIKDNPSLDRVEYERSLMNLHPYERAQLLDGDWDARPPGARFRREWFRIVSDMPSQGRRRTRAWDLAATEPKAGADPDWTAGARGCRVGDTFYLENMTRFRRPPGAIEAALKATAQADGVGVPVKIEQEPGASGKLAVNSLARSMAGHHVTGARVTGDKVVRSNPLAAAAERGDVCLVEGPWVSEFLTEAEHFPNGSHDDQVDAASLCFSEVMLGTWGFDELYSEEAAA